MGVVALTTHEIWASPSSIVGADGIPKKLCVKTIIDSCATSSGVVQGRRGGLCSLDAGSGTRSFIGPSLVQATTKTMHVLKRCNQTTFFHARYGFGVAWKA
jgi:hypothetical protein